MPRTKKKSNLAIARARMYRELIFECAERVFAQQGFDESSMADIAAEAGVSLKTLYATFEGKDDIYKEILTVRSEALLETSEDADPNRPALELLTDGIRSIVTYFVDHSDFFRILARDGQAWGVHPRSSAGQKGALEGAQKIRAIIEQGMDEGVFAPSDPDLAGASVMALLQVQMTVLLARDEEPDPLEVADLILVSMRRLLGVRQEDNAECAA